MSKNGKWLTWSKGWLLLILTFYISIGAAYSIVIPIAETPDESEHFRYMQAIVRSGQLPVMMPEREANVTIEAHQPPLYYLIGASVFKQFDLNPEDNPKDNICFSFEPEDKGRKTAFYHHNDEWPPQRDVHRAFYLWRWMSILMGTATICFAYLIGRLTVPKVKWFAPSVAALVAFNPQFIFITSSINNDVPNALFGTAIVALSIIAIKRKTLFVYLLLGLTVGLGILTKFALIAFWPLAFLAALWPSINLTKNPTKLYVNWWGLIGRSAVLLCLPLIIAGWWYWRNFQLYGDPLMWDVTLAAKGSVIARTTPFRITDLIEFVSMHFQSFWAWFGWLNVKAPVWVYGIFFIVILAAAAGLVRFILKRNVPVSLPALTINGFAVLAIYSSLFQYIQTINWTGYQGRLAFAAIAPITVFIVLGLAALGGKILTSLTGVGFGVISIFLLGTVLIPAYPRPQIYQPDDGVTFTCARFVDGLQIEAVDAADSVSPGEDLPVTVYGFGLEAQDKPQSMSLFLLGADDQEIGNVTENVLWQKGQPVEFTFNVPVVENADPAKALLKIAMFDNDGQIQPAASATGRNLTLPVVLDTIKVNQDEDLIVEPLHQTFANFGNNLHLIGYDWEEINENQRLVTLYWQGKSNMDIDFTTFVHVLDKKGELIAQNDGQPMDGNYPTSIWDDGEMVIDKKVMDISSVNGSKEFVVAVGVYDLNTLQRLPVWDSGGNKISNDQWILDP